MVNKEKFHAYVEVKKSGIINMWNIQRVRKIAKNFYNVELTKEDCLYIREHYHELKKKYSEGWEEVFKEG